MTQARRRAVATARNALLACAVASALAATCSGADEPDRDWIRFRNDPAQRLFAELPGTRSATPRGTTALLPVTNCADQGPGSLRDTVAAALDGDTIDLAHLTCSVITLTTGAVEVPVPNLILAGPGRTALAIDGNGADRVLFHPFGGALTLRGLALRNGHASAEGNNITGGGCIASAGYLVLQDSIVSGCSSAAVGSYGGAVYAYSMTMERSTLSGNWAAGIHSQASTAAFGGAAFVYSMELRQSTISDNHAWHQGNPAFSDYDIGGGIVCVRQGYLLGSTVSGNRSQGRGGGLVSFSGLAVVNSTISGNVAENDIAGGLFLRRPSLLQLYSSTVTANQSPLSGGGIWLNAPGSEFHGSIVAGNSSDLGNLDNRFGALPQASPVGGGHNLIGNSTPLVTLPADTLGGDPRLAALGYNGGPTRTHALLADSPALDAGINHASLATDQRGQPRVHGAAPDIGAYESQGVDGSAVIVPVPTASPAWLALLGVLLALGGLLRSRRRTG